MYKRTYTYLDSKNLIFCSQYGFRNKHSCKLATCELVGEIVQGLENKKHTTAVFLDLSKAFDTLDHKILLRKLEKYGIRCPALDWYNSYLSSHTIRVKCNTEASNKPVCSKLFPIEYGTPQGSCLGPLLFLIFTNDLHRNITFCKCILFADDTTIYLTHDNLSFLQDCLEINLAHLQDWFYANTLMLNLNKSQMMPFLHKPTIARNIKIGTETLPVATEFKFLGIWLDPKLSWNCHINNLLLKLKRNMNLLQNAKKFLNKQALLTVYYAHVHSHLNYGILLWGNMASNTQIKKIQKVQNKCMSYILNKKALTSDFKDSKLFTVNDMIWLNNVKLGYKLRHSHLLICIAELCLMNSMGQTLEKKHNYNTRQRTDSNQPLA